MHFFRNDTDPLNSANWTLATFFATYLHRFFEVKVVYLDVRGPKRNGEGHEVTSCCQGAVKLAGVRGDSLKFLHKGLPDWFDSGKSEIA